MTIDENTPPGLTIFRGIQALDTDKPNTPNSDVTYSIIQGNEDKKFSALEPLFTLTLHSDRKVLEKIVVRKFAEIGSDGKNNPQFWLKSQFLNSYVSVSINRMKTLERDLPELFENSESPAVKTQN